MSQITDALSAAVDAAVKKAGDELTRIETDVAKAIALIQSLKAGPDVVAVQAAIDKLTAAEAALSARSEAAATSLEGATA